MNSAEKLISEHGKGLYNFCLYLTRSRFEADDLYQQTLLKALGKNIDEKRNPKALLTKICVSEWQNEKRKMQRRHKIAPMCNYEDAEPFLSSGGDNVYESVEKKETISLVRRIISEMDDKHRLVIVLFYNAELSVKEIAKILNCPEGTVKSRLHTAKEILKKEMSDNEKH